MRRQELPQSRLTYSLTSQRKVRNSVCPGPLTGVRTTRGPMNCCPSQPALGPPPTSTAVFRCDCFFAMEIRENVLTESNIRDLVKLLDEEMDGVARDQRERLQNIEEELEDVKKRLARIWNHIETTDTEMADASDRIREHRERKEKLEIAAEEARALLKERRQFLDSADTIAAFATEMSEFLKTSELTETKAFVGSFVKEVVVKPGRAAIVYSIPISQSTPKTPILVGCGLGAS